MAKAGAQNRVGCDRQRDSPTPFSGAKSDDDDDEKEEEEEEEEEEDCIDQQCTRL